VPHIVLIPDDAPVVQFEGERIGGGTTKRKPKEERWYELDLYRHARGYTACVHYRTTRRLNMQERDRCWVIDATDRDHLADALAAWVKAHEWQEPLVLTGDPKAEVRRARIADALRQAFELILADALSAAR